MNEFTCLTREKLLAFLRDDLPEDFRFSGHVTVCNSCKGNLELLSVNPEWEERIRRLGGLPGSPDDSVLTRMIVRAKTLAPSLAASPDGHAVLETGVLGRYQLVRELGRGGMGQVYLAEHPVMERQVALKVIHPRHLHDERALQRFHREVKLLAKLTHENIVRAYDAGEDRGTHFLVMEFVDGVDLARLLHSAGKLCIGAACEIGRQASLALQHAHEHGLIHRDVKPSNLLLTSGGVVKLLDLGLARLKDEPVEGGELTQMGHVLGTPDYIAPEQVGQQGSVDIRADLYGLGCTLYHLIVGVPPFSGEAYATPLDKLLAHRDSPFPSIRARRPEVPEDLQELLHRLTAKDREQRPREPGEVALLLGPFANAADLRGLCSQVRGERPAEVASRPVQVPSVATPTPLPQEMVASPRQTCTGEVPSPRRRWPWLIAACLAAMIGGVLIAWAAGVLPPPQSGAQPQVPNAKARLPEEPSLPTPPPRDPEVLARRARAVLTKYCVQCHGEEYKVPGYNILDREGLVAPRGKDKLPYVTPGDPNRSELWQRVGVQEDMPPRDPGPSPPEIQVLKEWIQAGAPLPGNSTRPFLGPLHLLTVVEADLGKASSTDRPFLRYFSLVHLHDNPEVSAVQMRHARAALAKALNSLTWKSQRIRLRAIDGEQTVLAIDLRDVGWEATIHWKALLRVHPYELKLTGHSDGAVREKARQVEEHTLTRQVILRADWFVATALKPPLYDSLLELPGSLPELEKKLEVDSQMNFLNGRLARAGLTTSGVSSQNRLVERHDGKYGTYWRSYDFASNAGVENLVRFPLGPRFGENPFPDQAFVEAGGEVIFALPNGLHGYGLYDGQGKSLAQAPTDIVSDSLKTADTPSIVSGLSCIGCHRHGIIPVVDSIRTGSSVFGKSLDKVRELYPPEEMMSHLVRKDQESYLAAIKDISGPFLEVAEDATTAIEAFPEPVRVVARLYHRDLGLMEVAAELGIGDPKRLRQMIQDNPKLRVLGLGPVMAGGRIKRATWEAKTRNDTLFQRVAAAVGLGIPFQEQ